MQHIEVQDVSKYYTIGKQRITAVDRAALTIQEGDFVSLIGHSGSGKTTLLSIIGGIIRPTGGQVLYRGSDICTANDDALSQYRNTKVGFMFQFASLLPSLRVSENLLLPTLFNDGRGAAAGSHGHKVRELLSLVGLEDKVRAFPSQLSGGQQRRVAIARAFMNNPELILADEPTGDLDEETEQDMMDFFKSMNKSHRITFIMVTHNTDLARQANRCIRMHQGRLNEA